MLKNLVKKAIRGFATIAFYFLTCYSCLMAQNGILTQHQVHIEKNPYSKFIESNSSSSSYQLKEKSHWLIGGLVGLGTGALSTAIAVNIGGSTALCNQSANQDAIGSLECAGVITAGGLVGGGIGMLIGSFIKKRHKELETIEVKAGVLTPGGIGLGFELSF